MAQKIRNEKSCLFCALCILSILTAIIAITALLLAIVVYMDNNDKNGKDNGDPVSSTTVSPTLPINPCQDQQTIKGDIAHGLFETNSLCFGKKKVYCDQTTLGGGWLRLHYKTGAKQCTPFRMDSEQIKCLVGKRAGKFEFPVSSDVNTLNSAHHLQVKMIS